MFANPFLQRSGSYDQVVGNVTAAEKNLSSVQDQEGSLLVEGDLDCPY